MLVCDIKSLLYYMYLHLHILAHIGLRMEQSLFFFKLIIARNIDIVVYRIIVENQNNTLVWLRCTSTTILADLPVLFDYKPWGEPLRMEVASISMCFGLHVVISHELMTSRRFQTVKCAALGF